LKIKQTNFIKHIEIVGNLGYYKGMNIKCRILSVFIVIISAVVIGISAIVINRKQDNETIYAESINFVGNISAADIYINNALVLDNKLINVEPNNCTLNPELEIKKRGGESKSISMDKYYFDEAGIYTITCKILKNKNYYIKDTIKITVVESLTEDLSMYIKHKASNIFYIEDTINLSQVAEIVGPENAEIDLKCSTNLLLNNDAVTAIATGYAQIEIMLSYNNIKILNTIPLIIKPKAVVSDIALKLISNGKVIQNNEIEITKSKFNLSVIYELINIDNQQINCWTDSSIIEIIGFDSMMIELKTLDIGEGIIYVIPVDYPQVVFEIVVKIVDYDIK